MERLSNNEVAEQMKEAVAAMEVKGENRFGIRAYQNAIASIDSLTSSIYDLWENGRLSEIAGVGPSLEQHLNELFTKGRVKEWEQKKEDLPEGMFTLLVVRGIGAKTAYKLAKTFKLNNRETALEKVKEAAETHKIQDLPGFGEKSENDILEAIRELKKSKQEKPRTLLFRAEEIAGRVIEHLKKLDSVEEAVPLGSLRRRKATVGDLDIAVSSTKPGEVIDHFVKFEEVANVESQGENMSTVLLNNETQVDILVSDPESFGSLLQHFTGSKQHNIELRTYALEKGMSLSQYGIKEGKELKKFSTEKAFYEHLGLNWIPPEIREGSNEIQLAAKGNLPKLVELADIKGDLHTHTVDSDGSSTIFEMVEKAKSLGYEYVGISDHAPSVQARGRYDVLGIVEQKRKQIDELNANNPDIKILYGYEVNILKDATLNMPEDIMEKLDYVIASIHTSFDQSREEITERLIKAIVDPLVTIVGHPAGRLINERDSLEVNWDKVFDAAVKYNKIIEINSQPSRLDLPDHLVRDALKKGVRIMINTDAHITHDMDFMKFGVDVARRGWCEKQNIVNTLPLKKFLKALK